MDQVPLETPGGGPMGTVPEKDASDSIKLHSNETNNTIDTLDISSDTILTTPTKEHDVMVDNSTRTNSASASAPPPAEAFRSLPLTTEALLLDSSTHAEGTSGLSRINEISKELGYMEDDVGVTKNTRGVAVSTPLTSKSSTEVVIDSIAFHKVSEEEEGEDGMKNEIVSPPSPILPGRDTGNAAPIMPKSVTNPTTGTPFRSSSDATPKTKHVGVSNGDISAKESEESVDASTSNDKIQSHLSSSFDYSSSLNRSIDGDAPSLSSSNMSASRSLQPRSLTSDGSSQFTPRKGMELHMHNYGTGSRSPSVLSSNSSKGDRKSLEKKEADRKKRMKHLSLLLDRHHKKTIMNKTSEDSIGEVGVEKVLTEDTTEAVTDETSKEVQDQVGDAINSTGMKSSEEKNGESERGTNGYQAFPFRSSERRMSASVASVSTSATSKKRTSLFDSFEKTWSSLSSSVDAYETERLCFASLVSVLLEGIQNRPSKKAKASLSSSRKGGRRQGRSDKQSGQIAVPVEVVKLFWKRVVLARKVQSQDGNDSDETLLDAKIDSVLETLVEKLRYLVLLNSSELPFSSYLAMSGKNTKQVPTMVLYLSHDVYGEYSKRILQSKGLLNDTVEQWHDAFSHLLADESVLSYDRNEAAIHGEKMKDLQTYAAYFLPRHMISSFESVSKIFVEEHEKETYKNRVSRFVKLMNSTKFLSRRMKEIGWIQSAEAIDLLTLDMRASRKSKKGNSQHAIEDFVIEHWDILKPSQVHLQDIERFFTLFIGRFDQVPVMVDEDIVDRTTATLTLYTSWKDQCLHVLTKAKKNLKEGNAERNSLHQQGNKEDEDIAAGEQASKVSTISTAINNSDLSSKAPTTKRHLNARKRNTQFVSLVRSSTEVLGELPNRLKLETEVYGMDDTNGTTSLVKRTDASALINMKLAKANPWKQSRVLGNSNRNLDAAGLGLSVASMQLQDALDINLVTLYLDTLYGKVLNMINRSISTQVSVDAESSNMGSVEVLRSPVVTNTKVALSASSIDIYTNIMKVISFLLSDDLDDVDENDLMDLGYYYDGDDGIMNPSSRIKKLKCDRSDAELLMARLKVLCSDSWFEMGGYLFDGIKAGHASSIEMSGLQTLHNMLGNDISTSNEPETIDYDHADLDGHGIFQLQMKVIQCYHVALALLDMNSKQDDKKSIGKRRLHESSESMSMKQHIETVKRTLYASIIHKIGVHYYEQEGNLSAAKTCLEEALTRRRLLLRHLQNEEEDADYGSGSSVSSMSSIASNTKRGVTFDPKYGEARSRRRKKGLSLEKNKDSDSNNRVDVLLISNEGGKKEIDSLELGLSSTLEFLALTSHSLQDYQSALSLFQEALILRALHAGKNSLEVSSLQYNMGVVHDDLGQHEASLGRYGESLRVRMIHLDSMSGDFPKVIDNVNGMSYLEDLESTIVLTLRCMGNVYRALHDITNALGSYLKAIALLKEKLKRSATNDSSGVYQTRSGELGFGKVKGGRQSSLPMPVTLFAEMREGKIAAPVYQTDRKGKLTPQQSKVAVLSEEDRVRKEIANLYSTLVTLVNDRKKQMKSRSSRSGYNSSGGHSSDRASSSSARNHYNQGYNSSGSKNSKKQQLNESDDDDCILLDAAFNLGMLTMHFGEFRNAICYFEEALRTLFISNPDESSYESSSDSDFSDRLATRNKIKSQIKARKYEGKAEEGTIYHALAVTHAALLDHERAVRYYMTALRFYRQHMGMESLKVAGALYDCGLSYWHMNEHKKAGDFWADSLRILLLRGVDSEKSSASELYVANTLYNLAASKICQGEYGDIYTHTCLDDAFEIFRQLDLSESGSFSVQMAHCYFYLGFAHYSRVPDVSSPESTKPYIDESADKSIIKSRSVKTTNRADLKSKEDYLQYALSCMDEALNIYVSQEIDHSSNDVSTVGQNMQHPMQAHVAHLTGLIYDGLGYVSQALWNFTTALRLMNKVYSEKNVYSASIMQDMGSIFISVNNSPAAMKCFEDSLAIRKPLLGSSHPVVATSLHNLAGLHGILTDYRQSISMYSQCLKIRLENEGSDGEGVAETLLQMGIVNARYNALNRSLDCLEGAFKIRKSRISHLNANQNNSLRNGSDDGSKEENENSKSDDVNYERTLRVEEAELAKVLHHIGNIRLKNDESEDAIRCYEDALVIQRELCGFSTGGFAEFAQRQNAEENIKKHEKTLMNMADNLHNLGWAYEVNGVLERALNCFNEALVLKRSLPNLLGANIPIEEAAAVIPLDEHMNKCTSMTSANTLQRIGSIHIKLYNYDIALSYYKTALRIQRRSLGKDHIVVACTLSEMGKVMKQRMKSTYDLFGNDTVGLDKVAMKCFNESLRITQRQFGSNHKAVADVMFDIGTVHDYNNEYMEALSCYERSTQVYSRMYTKILCQRLCDISTGNMMKTAMNELEDEKYFPIGLTGNFPNTTEYGVLSTLATASTKRQDRMTTHEAREMYMKASFALNMMKKKTGMSGNSFTSMQDMELIFLRFLEMVTVYGVDPVRNTMYQYFGNFGKVFQHFERATNHATISTSDTLTLANLPLIEN